MTVLSVPRLAGWPDLAPGWRFATFAEVATIQSDQGRRVPQRSYQPRGALAVVDQGEELVGGFTDDVSLAAPSPCVLFGDHTRRVKLIEFPFAVGAQGVKLLSPTANVSLRFLAYLLAAAPLPDKGYARHFQYLRSSSFPIPALDVQAAVVDEIEKQFTRLRVAEAAVERVRAGMARHEKSALNQLLNPDSRGEWRTRELGEVILSFDSRRVPLKRLEREKRPGRFPYYGASGVIDSIDDYIFDGRFLLVAEDGANLLSRSLPIAFHAEGKFWVNNHAHVLQTTDEISTDFLALILNQLDVSPYVTGTAQPKLTQSALKRIIIKIPTLEAQESLVAESQRISSATQALRGDLFQQLNRVRALKMAILKRAFSGNLVGIEAA